MPDVSRQTKATEIRRLMETEGAAVAENTQAFNAGRYASVDGLDDYEELKQWARDIKEDAIERLPQLIEEVRRQIEERGGSVYLAEDAVDANRYIADVVGEADRLVKSKSMTSEEIGINEFLERRGVEVIETDLGEWVLQVAEEAPSHIVAPAIHKSRAAIADLFNQHFDPDPPLETAKELTRFARKQLGRCIQEADVGMTGANFITADTGTIALVTSEGNARKTALVPSTHIAVAGIEKIIPRVEDLQPFAELIGRSGTGQDLTSYFSLLTPPVPSPVPNFDRPDEPMEGGEREFHLVLLDNGRTDMREDPQLRETLYCIRCGACANSCVNFQQVGGHAFGGETYSGGIATGWEAGVHGLESAASFNDLCTGCTRCMNACPVNIDIPWINVVIRDRINREEAPNAIEGLVDGLWPDAEPDGVSLARKVIAHVDTLARWGARIAPIARWLARRRPVRWLLERAVGIDPRRDLPRLQSTTLRSWFQDRPRPSVEDPDVIFVPDTYTNYVWPERGQAAIRALEAVGCGVGLADVGDVGRPALSQGMISTATARAEAVSAALAPHLEAGRRVVFVEPTDLAMVQGEYQKLLPTAEADRLADASLDVMSVLQNQWTEGDSGKLRTGGGRKLIYHSHCQQRTYGLQSSTVEVLEHFGYNVATTSAECCGMAGSFGYKSDYYELSMRVGEALRDEVVSLAGEEATVVASGISCREQLEAVLDRSVVHPVQLLV
ncbi:(4Fe-4S)-binding protein [Salinibacter sp. 10B]|uniref:LUD domain-containing protein n=1 Tax=Salinibacter sp. 10B TaxID=1923971 RepID=UPI000CF4B47F|nr:LUD domain-containing protein [Salinibacter sp. 10B]PQJ33295.1 (4Fe-4S)-binding protein [Salinibacter sp. 10B]